MTGHTGFKGSWLVSWLTQMGASVYGYSLEPAGKPNLFDVLEMYNLVDGNFGDVRDFLRLDGAIKTFRPEIIFHLAAQPLVKESYIDPITTYTTNIVGTVNLLEAARHTKTVRAVVNITTDKCYENKEWHWGYREDEAMGGYDPYSASKGCSEIITSSFIRSFYDSAGIGLATARAGNVIGGGDWADDRLIPDLVRGLEANSEILIRNPNSVRPWQHVLEPLSGYIRLAELLFNNPIQFSGAWNFGPNDQDAKTVGWIADLVCEAWGTGAHWKMDDNTHPHEAQYLKLDISKARALLGWVPKWSARQAVENTVKWYKHYHSDSDIKKMTFEQIVQYENTACFVH